MNKPSLSIVVYYNERENISKIVTRLKKTLKGINHEIIFVDDNSWDGTSDEIKLFIENKSKNKSNSPDRSKDLSGAIIEGIYAAKADLVGVMVATYNVMSPNF